MPGPSRSATPTSLTFGNPWARGSTPGGSSGGEAVALATEMSCLGLGNDAGGSLRLRVLFNGVLALKPGYGRFASDRSVGPRHSTVASQLIPEEGVLARSAVDLDLAFQILAGCEPGTPGAPRHRWGVRRPLSRCGLQWWPAPGDEAFIRKWRRPSKRRLRLCGWAATRLKPSVCRHSPRWSSPKAA